MKLLTKTLLIFFLLINIVFVKSPKSVIHDEGQSSGSKVNAEEEEEIEDPEFKMKVENCEKEIFAVFKNDEPFDNFCEGLLHLNQNNFDGQQGYSETAKSYYFDLFDTLGKLNLPQLITPKTYCRRKHRELTPRCIETMRKTGCDVSADGIACIQHLYIHWKKRDGSTPIPGTENMSDAELLRAIYRGCQNPYNPVVVLNDLTDQNLLEDYYNKKGNQRLSQADIYEHYQAFMNQGGSGIDYPTFSRLAIQAERESYLEHSILEQARYERYGVRNVAYLDLFREYLRRDNLKNVKFYDSYYAIFLIDEIKKYDCSQFKKRRKYCIEYLKSSSQQPSS